MLFQCNYDRDLVNKYKLEDYNVYNGCLGVVDMYEHEDDDDDHMDMEDDVSIDVLDVDTVRDVVVMVVVDEEQWW